jgi:SAM-dependent methyltransferase
MSESFAYTGEELDAMAEAANYRSWILDTFKPYLGKHLVEVGAGLGSFSELILKRHDCDTLSLVEPSESMYQRLVAFANQVDTSTRVEVFHGMFTAVASEIVARQTPDSIIYINVLEHVEDDEGELKAVCQSLSSDGRVLIFVPALARLYGKIDEQVGHLRRYSRTELAEKMQRAGFKIVRSGYFDLPGVLPWWIKYRLLKSTSMEPGSVKLYDRFVIPTVRRIETLIPPPIGKNVIMIGQKI